MATGSEPRRGVPGRETRQHKERTKVVGIAFTIVSY